MWGGTASSFCLLCPVLASSSTSLPYSALTKDFFNQCEMLCAVLHRQWVWKKNRAFKPVFTGSQREVKEGPPEVSYGRAPSHFLESPQPLALNFNTGFEELQNILKCCMCFPDRVKRNHLFCQSSSEVTVNTVIFSFLPISPHFHPDKAKSLSGKVLHQFKKNLLL